MSRILVSGSTGVMGSRVVRLLQALAPDVETIAGTHRRPAPPDVLARRFDRSDPEGCRTALRDVAVLVDASGPYTRDPTPILDLCEQADVAYVDLAACPRWLDRVHAASGSRETCVVPGASTVPGMIELLVAELGTRVARVEADLLMASSAPPGRGMLISLLRPLGRPLPGGEVSFGRLEERGGRRYGRFPAPPLFLAGTSPLPCRFAIGFDRPAWGLGLRAAAPFLGRLPERALPTLAALMAPATGLASRFGGDAGRLDVRAYDAEDRLLRHDVVLAASDPLEVPALPAVLVARAMARGGPEVSGYTTTATFVSAADFREALEARGGRIESGA